MAIAQRQGLGGRTRHVKVQYLWIQNAVNEKELKIAKVHTDSNPADALTKFLKAEKLDKHVKKMNFIFREGRADSSSILDGI